MSYEEPSGALPRRETEVGQFAAFQELLLAIRSARAEYQVGR